jgi:aminomethyltransferase
MGRIWLTGSDAIRILNWLTTADVSSLRVSRAKYTLICNDKGGIIDDGILYRLGEEKYLLICNASNRAKVWAVLTAARDKQFNSVELDDLTTTIGMIALQGPFANEAMNDFAPGIVEALRPFQIRRAEILGQSMLVARTGYTGEDGFEIMPESTVCPEVWYGLVERGAAPCGLGSRDILRLEAGLLLHGSDMDETVNPFEAGLDRFVFTEKESMSSASFHTVLKHGINKKLVGFLMVDRGVPRHGFDIIKGETIVGVVTSGGYSPSLDSYIGLGYVPIEAASPGTLIHISVRGRLVEAQVTTLPFYTRRKS